VRCEVLSVAHIYGFGISSTEWSYSINEPPYYLAVLAMNWT